MEKKANAMATQKEKHNISMDGIGRKKKIINKILGWHNM